MPTYAILGATGATGGSILRLLLDAPGSDNPVALHIYARSREKLLRQLPSLASRHDIQIFEGSINDNSVMSACLAHTDVVFSCIARNESVPGMDIAQEASKEIIRTLKQAKIDHPDVRTPHVVVLSAAPVNPALAAKMLAIPRWLVTSAFSHAYADLRVAEQMYREEKDWLPETFVQPPGLTSGSAQGYRLHHGEGPRPAFLSYLDLAAAMIDVARCGPNEHRDWVSVASVSENGLKPELKVLLSRLFKGLLAHYSPGLWQKFRAWGWL